MKNPEQAIEKLLSGLSNADVPQGMERRILKALQDHASAEPLSGWRRLKPLWLAAHAHRASALSAACAIAGVLVLSLYYPALRRSGRPTAPSRTSAPSSSSPASLQPLPSTATVATSQASSLTASASIARSTKKFHTRQVAIANADDSLAESELHAASLPEPPMPLTEQERLLLRIVHSNDPVELAELDATAWATRNAAEKAEFDRFFEPKKAEATGDTK